jgi:Uma2 family endonuclease
VERARYRVPDIIICPQPVLLAKIVTSIPWAVIEVLSPEDSVPEQLPRFRDYDQIGVRHMILLDPEALVAKRFENGVLVPPRLTSLELPTGTLPFDTEVLFQQLVEEREAIAEAL